MYDKVMFFVLLILGSMGGYVRWLERLILSGLVMESIVSFQPGFLLVTLIDPRSGKRVLYWNRSGQITCRSVEHLKRLVNVRVDKLFIEFDDKPEIDPVAEQKLREMFSEIEIHTRKELGEELKSLPKLVELYGGDIVIVKKREMRGSLRLFEADRVLEVLDKVDDRSLWLLVIEVTKDGKVKIFDDYKHRWREYVKKMTEEGSKVLIFAIWHGNQSTDIFLLYPQLEEENRR